MLNSLTVKKELNSKPCIEESISLKITENAFLQYFTKVLGFNLEDIKREIMNDLKEQKVLKNNSGKYHKIVGKNLFTFVIINGILTCIIQNEI